MSQIQVEGAENGFPVAINAASPDRGLAVTISKLPYYSVRTGVITATPTVVLPDGSRRALAPIRIVIESRGYYY